jgi:hypothetical protein
MMEFQDSGRKTDNVMVMETASGLGEPLRPWPEQYFI